MAARAHVHPGPFIVMHDGKPLRLEGRPSYLVPGDQATLFPNRRRVNRAVNRTILMADRVAKSLLRDAPGFETLKRMVDGFTVVPCLQTR